MSGPFALIVVPAAFEPFVELTTKSGHNGCACPPD